MNLRGLEVLLGTLGGILLLVFMTNGLHVAALGYAGLAVSAVLLVDLALISRFLPHYRVTRHWGQVATSLPGVRLVGDGGRNAPRLRGTFGACAVRVDPTGAGWKTTVRPVHRDDWVGLQLDLRKVSRRGISPPPSTGDALFDLAVQTHADPPEAVLVLDHTLRREVVEALLSGVRICGDRIEWNERFVVSAAKAADRLARMTDLATRLFAVTSNDLRARARETIQRDPRTEARARMLWIYQEQYVLNDEDRPALDLSRRSLDNSVRLAAAAADLASAGAPGDAAEAEAMLAEAIARATAPAWLLGAAVLRLLEFGRPEVVSAALQARLQNDGALPVEILRWALTQPSSLSPAAVAARLSLAPEQDAADAVDVLLDAGPAFESTVAALLEHCSEGVVGRAIAGLSARGTHRCLAALHTLSRNSRVLPRLREAATEARNTVQARTRGTPGQLSLADLHGPVGDLSVVETPRDRGQ